MTGLALPDPENDATDEAIERAERHADADWMVAAYGSAEAVGKSHRYVTSDHVHEYLERHFPEITTHDKRALGPVMRRAAADGLIEPTGHYRISDRAVAHRNPKRIWRSLVYEEAPS